MWWNKLYSAFCLINDSLCDAKLHCTANAIIGHCTHQRTCIFCETTTFYLIINRNLAHCNGRFIRRFYVAFIAYYVCFSVISVLSLELTLIILLLEHTEIYCKLPTGYLLSTDWVYICDKLYVVLESVLKRSYCRPFHVAKTRRKKSLQLSDTFVP